MFSFRLHQQISSTARLLLRRCTFHDGTVVTECLNRHEVRAKFGHNLFFDLMVKYSGRCFSSQNRSGNRRPPSRRQRVADSIEDPSAMDIDKHPEVVKTLDEIRADFNDEHHWRSPQLSNVDKEKVPKQLQEKYVLYRDADAELILNAEEEQVQRSPKDQDPNPDVDVDEFIDDNDRPQKEKPQWIIEDLNFKRGLTGVFDIGDLIEVLEAENAVDILTVAVPKEYNYADYLVIVNGRSSRHLKAIIEFVNKMYKWKKDIKDNFLKVQGKDSKDWMSLDMDNIVLHVMLSEVREKYDLDSLWAVGEQYDAECQKKEEPFMDALQQHLKYLNEVAPDK